jgi:hypothetical protein
MSDGKRRRKAKQALAGVKDAPLTWRDSGSGETDQGAGAKERPGPGTGQLQEEEQLPLTIRLRNGTEIDGRAASAEWELLDELRQKRPDLFEALAAMTFGEGTPPGKAVKKELKRKWWLDQVAGEVRPHLRKVIEACYEKTENGRMWRPLLDENDVKGKLAMQIIEEEQPARMRELMRQALRAEQERGRD